MPLKKSQLAAILALSIIMCGSDAASENAGKVTCKNVEDVFSRLTDGLSIGFCIDASRDCKNFENFKKIDKKNPLRIAMTSFFPAQLDRNLQLCSLAVLAYNPSYYDNLSKTE